MLKKPVNAAVYRRSILVSCCCFVLMMAAWQIYLSTISTTPKIPEGELEESFPPSPSLRREVIRSLPYHLTPEEASCSDKYFIFCFLTFSSLLFFLPSLFPLFRSFLCFTFWAHLALYYCIFLSFLFMFLLTFVVLLYCILFLGTAN